MNMEEKTVKGEKKGERSYHCAQWYGLPFFLMRFRR